MKPETFKGSWWCGQHLGGGVLGGEYKTSLTVYHSLSKSTNLSMTWFCIRWFCHWGACMSLQPESVSTPNLVLLNMSDWTIWRVSNGFSPNCIDLREEAHNFPVRLIQFSKRASAAWSLRGLTWADNQYASASHAHVNTEKLKWKEVLEPVWVSEQSPIEHKDPWPQLQRVIFFTNTRERNRSYTITHHWAALLFNESMAWIKRS